MTLPLGTATSRFTRAKLRRTLVIDSSSETLMSNPTRVLLFVLVALAGLGIWLFVIPDSSDSGEVASEPGDVRFVPESGANLDVPEVEPPIREVLQVEADTREETQQENPEMKIVPYVTHELRGTLTLLDELGNGPFLESGSFSFWIWQRDEPSLHEVQVQRGEWETVLPDGVRISMAEVELGGRVAAFVAEDGPPIDVPASGYLELEAYIPKASVLRVYGLDTQAELDQITVIVERRESLLQHPGEFGAENRVVEGAASPIELSAVSGVRINQVVTYFVKAQGYGWSSLQVKHSDGGDRQIYLTRSGALEVHLSEFDPELYPTFRLWRWRRPVFETTLNWERELKIEDLEAGEYTASVDIGRNWRQLERLGEAQVTIHAGGTSVVDLQLSSGPQYARGHLSGVLVVPSEWNLNSFRLFARLQSEVASKRDSVRVASSVELANVAGREDAWQFHFPDVIAGEWQLGVEPTLYATVETVTSEETEGLLIEVPPPAQWTVRCIDPHTRKPALIEELRFGRVLGYTPERELAERGAEPNVFHIRAPIGRVSLRAEGEGYRRVNRTFDLDAREGEIELEVPSECGIELEAHVNGRSIAWPEIIWVGAGTEDGSGFSYNHKVREGRFCLLVNEPGVYKIEIDDLEGFEPIPAFEVAIEPGDFGRADVELVRKQ